MGVMQAASAIGGLYGLIMLVFVSIVLRICLSFGRPHWKPPTSTTSAAGAGAAAGTGGQLPVANTSLLSQQQAPGTHGPTSPQTSLQLSVTGGSQTSYQLSVTASNTSSASTNQPAPLTPAVSMMSSTPVPPTPQPSVQCRHIQPGTSSLLGGSP
jgi:hypothetical protein